MKKQILFLFIIIIIASMVLFACGDPEEGTELTINNQSSVTVYNVIWNGLRFCSDAGWGGYRIVPGATSKWTGDVGSSSGSSSKNVAPGSGYVFFQLSDGGTQYRSLKKLTVSPGEVVIFYITNDTIEAKKQ
jgi:hypothetical protein